jgi:hypothetical protein
MKKNTHDPEECMRNIFQLLVYKKKRIGFLFGAGTSKSEKVKEKSLIVPDIRELTAIIEKELLEEKDNEGKLSDKYKGVISNLKTDLGCNYNIETILSNLELKHEVIGSEIISGLNKEQYSELILKIKGVIKRKTSVHVSDNIDFDSLIQSDFASWIGQADRTFGIEIFTTNYDYLFELGLEHYNIPYFDGFTGSYKPFFNSEAVESCKYLQNQTKLWKIHGSLGWHTEKETKKIIRFEMPDNDDIFIYPSVFKYSDSKKQPYLSLLDRLSKFLSEDDTVLFTCGYSFNDFHINERLTNSLNNESNSHIIALYYDEYMEDEIKKYRLDEKSHVYSIAKANGKLSILGMRSAIIGRQLGKWKIQREPDNDITPSIIQYFDEDGPDYIKNEEINKEFKGSVFYEGEGVFKLPNFIHFVNFLNSMVADNPLQKSLKNDNK